MGTNLLNDPTKDAGNSHTTYNIADFDFNTSLIAGQTYTVTAKVTTSAEKTGVGFYHSGGALCMYPNQNMGDCFTPITSDGIYSVVFVATDDMAAQTANAGHGYCRVFVTNAPGAALQGSVAVAGTAHVD